MPQAAYLMTGGATYALNRPVAAYRYVTPYSDLTDLPLTVAIRNQEVPETTLPAQVARQPSP